MAFSDNYQANGDFAYNDVPNDAEAESLLQWFDSVAAYDEVVESDDQFDFSVAETSNIIKDIPVESGSYLVRQGDCISSIAFKAGHIISTIWNDPKNRKLKDTRKDHNTLLPGDKLHIPDITTKSEAGNTRAHHRFKRKGIPESLRIKLIDDDGGPLLNTMCRIDIDGKIYNVSTDDEGVLRVPIHPQAEKGLVIIEESETELPLQIGYSNPLDTWTGLKQRLENLDLLPGDSPDDQDTTEALRNFQLLYDLEQTGRLDDPTLKQLNALEDDK